MTAKEAKNLIKRTLPKGNSAIDIMLREALDLAIQALEVYEQRGPQPKNVPENFISDIGQNIEPEQEREQNY